MEFKNWLQQNENIFGEILFGTTFGWVNKAEGELPKLIPLLGKIQETLSKNSLEQDANLCKSIMSNIQSASDTLKSIAAERSKDIGSLKSPSSWYMSWNKIEEIGWEIYYVGTVILSIKKMLEYSLTRMPDMPEEQGSPIQNAIRRSIQFLNGALVTTEKLSHEHETTLSGKTLAQNYANKIFKVEPIDKTKPDQSRFTQKQLYNLTGDPRPARRTKYRRIQ